MKALKWFFLVVVAFVIQTEITPFDVLLNLSGLVVFLYSLGNIPDKPYVKGYWTGHGEMKAIFFGATVGLIEDGLAGSIIGPSIMSKALMGFFTVFIFTEVFSKFTVTMASFVLFCMTALEFLVMFVLRLLFTDLTLNIPFFVRSLIIQSTANLLLGSILIKSGERHIGD